MNKLTKSIAGLVVLASFGACSAGPQQTTSPSGSNATTHGAPKGGQMSGSSDASR